jgi:hypothetical protein
MAPVIAINLISEMTAVNCGVSIIAQTLQLRHTVSALWISLRGIANATNGKNEEVTIAVINSVSTNVRLMALVRTESASVSQTTTEKTAAYSSLLSSNGL